MGTCTICCPNCGSYVKAYNGLRGMIQNHITCGNCNETIDVKSNRMISVICPSCKNSVLYAQGKKVPKCPVCNNVSLCCKIQLLLPFMTTGTVNKGAAAC